MKKRRTTSPAARPAAPSPLRQTARGLLLALAVVLPLVGGKLADWQTGLVALFTVLIAILALVAGTGGGQRPPEDWAWVALLVLLAVAILWAPYKHGAGLAVVQVLSYALCFWLARGLLGGQGSSALAAVLALGGAIVGVIALREYLQTLRTTGSGEWRVFATFFNPNLVAAYLLVSLPAGVALVARYWKLPEATAPGPPRRSKHSPSPRPQEGMLAWARPLAVAATLLMVVALPLTGSKGGALAAVAAAVTFVWTVAPAGTRAGRRLRGWLLVGGAVVVLLGLLAPPLRSRLVAAFSTQSNSSMFRYYTWGGMLRMIEARPLQGFGPGSFELAYPRYAQTGFTRLGHQSYLQVATEAGLPALAAYLALWVLLLRALRRRRSALDLPSAAPGPEESRSWARLWTCAALAALTGFLVHNLVDYSWYCPAVTASLFLLIGSALGDQASAAAALPEPRHTRPVLGALVALGLLGALLVVFLLAQAALAAGRSSAPPQAVVHATRATRLDPADAEAWQLLAGAWAAQAAPPYANSRELGKAIAARLQAARARPSDPTNWRRLALLYRDFGDLDAALEATARALQYNPNYILGIADQARLAEQAGREELATASWQRLADLYDTPIRKYAALEYPDPTYLYAWDYLQRRADREGDRALALSYRRRMAALLVDLLSRSPVELTLMQSVQLLREGDLANLRLMAAQTAEKLRATGEASDAEWAARLETAREPR